MNGLVTDVMSSTVRNPEDLAAASYLVKLVKSP